MTFSLHQGGQSAEHVKYAKIFGEYFWLIFIPTEDLGDHFFLILCLLKILATHSLRFYAYWRSWWRILANFMLTEDLGKSMATHSCCICSCFTPIFKKYCSCYVLKKIMQWFASLGTYETGLIWNGMIILNAVRKLIKSFWKKKKIVG